MIEQGEVWTFDDNEEYVVASIIDISKKKYVYLINKDNYKKFMIGEYLGSDIEEVEDPDLLETLIARFNEDLKESLPKIIAEYL